MTRVLRCGDVIPGCNETIVGATEQEVMAEEAAHAMRAHGLRELAPDLQQRILSKITHGGGPRPSEDTYAHVNIWHLTAAGESSDDAGARAIGARLREQPGFRSFTVVRTGDREVVAVTVFDSDEQLQAAIDAVTGLVRQHVAPLADRPERREGPVLLHIAA